MEAVLPGDLPDHSLVDCLFVEPSREVLDTVERVTALHEERDGLSLVDLEEVRRALVEADEHDSSGRACESFWPDARTAPEHASTPDPRGRNAKDPAPRSGGVGRASLPLSTGSRQGRRRVLGS